MNLMTKMRYGVGNIIEKLNPAQPLISGDEGSSKSSTIPKYTVVKAYENVTSMQRGVNLLVDSSAAINIDVKEKIQGLGVLPRAVKKNKLKQLMNYQPNLYQDIDSFRRAVYLDLILDGNAFIYYDGAHLYQLPAHKVEILTSKKTYIKGYKYGTQEFTTQEIIFIKENSGRSIFRGDSRLKAALNTVHVLRTMLKFQETYFKNNAIPGLVISTPNILSEKIKERTLFRWMQTYNPTNGRRPMLLDGDFKVDSLGKNDMRELDFADSIVVHENTILKAIGVPPILLESGNNANITPNNKMFYTNTVLPLVNKVTKAMEFYFGYDLKEVTQDIVQLQPELADKGNYLSTMVNAAIMTRNEAREIIRLEEVEQKEACELVLPANVAGSAALGSSQESTQGGAPKKKPEDKKPPAGAPKK